MIIALKILAAMLGGVGGTGLYWGLKRRAVQFPIGHRLPYSREHFARQYWLGLVGYSLLLVGGAVAYVLL